MAYKSSLNTSQMLDMAHNRIDSGNGAENTNSALSAYAGRYNNAGAIARDNRTRSQQKTDQIIAESNAAIESANNNDFWTDNWFGKILTTVGDVVFDVLEGAAKGIEGIADFGAQVGAQVGSWFGADTSGIQDWIEADFLKDFVHLYDQDFYIAMQKGSYLRDMGIVGDVIEGVGHGVGQMAPSIISNIALPGSGMVVFTAGAIGNATEEAYLEGASTEEASVYGLLSGAVEAGTELIVGGGMSAMGSSSILQKGLRKLSANTTVQKALAFIGGSVGEGIEEIASDLINPVIKRVYDENSFDAYSDPEFGSQLIYDGVVGALTGMVLNVSQLTTRRQTNATYQELKTLETKAENIKNNKRLSPEKKQAQLAEIQEQIKNKQALYADNINKLSKKIEVKKKNGDEFLLNAAGTYLEQGDDGKFSVKNLDRNFSDSVSYGVTNADIKTHITDKGYKLYEGAFEGQEKVSKDLLDNAIININRTAEKSGKGTNTRLNYAIVENINDENIASDIDTQNSLQYNKKKSYYDQYNTEAKSWAFNSQRKEGDTIALYDPKTNSWNKLVAENTDDGYAVMQSIKDTPQNRNEIDNMFVEVKNDNNGRQQRNHEEIYANIAEYGNVGKHNKVYRDSSTDNGANGRDSGVVQGEPGSNGYGISKRNGENHLAIKGKDGKIYGYIEENSNLIVISKDALNTELDFTFKYGDGKTSTRKVNAALSTLLHEVTHFAENAPEYDDLAKFVLNNVKLDDAEISDLEQSYGLAEGTYIKAYEFVVENDFDFTNKNEKANADERKAVSEVMATSMERLLADENYIRRLTQDNTSLAKRILNKIHNMWSLIKGESKNESELRSILKTAEKLYNKAIANVVVAARTGELKYSLKGEQVDPEDKLTDLYGVDFYTEHELQNFENSSKIAIARNVADVIDFVSGEKSQSKLYIGKVNSELGNRIASVIGADITGYNISISKDFVLHIEKNHSDIIAEKNRGQIAISRSDIFNIIEAVTNPDNIKATDGSVEKSSGVEFTKKIDGEYYALGWVSNKHHNLELKTARKKGIKKEAFQHAENANALSSTSNTSVDTASFNNSIREESSNVNTKNENNTRFSVRNNGIDSSEETRYNKYGWVKENNVINNKEYRDFFECMSDLKNGAVYPQDADGNYIIAVGESGVKNTLIFTDGNYESPSVEKVVKIRLNNETQLSDTRSDIYASEQSGLSYESNGILEVHTRENYEVRNNDRSTGKNVRMGQGERDGSRTPGKTRYSLKTERASSELTKTVKKTAMQQVDEKIDDILDHSRARLTDSEKAALRNDESVKEFRQALHEDLKEDGALPSLKTIIEEYSEQYNKVQKAINDMVAATEAATFARESVKGLFEKHIDRAVSNTEKVDFSDAEKKKAIVSVLNKIKNYVAENCINVYTDKNGTVSRRVKQLTAENIREISKSLSEVYNKNNPALEGRINDFAANTLKELQDLSDNALNTVQERTTKEFEFARAVSVAMRELTLDDSIDMTAYGGKKTTNHAYAKDYKDSMERAHKIDPGSFALHNGFFTAMRRIGVSFADADAVFRTWDAYQSGGTRNKKGAMFYGLFQNIVAGEAKGRKKKIEMLSLINDFYKEHKSYERSLTKTKLEINDRDGNKISISKDHLISLILTLESSHGMEHSLGDGLRLAEKGSDLTVDLHFDYADLENLRSHLDALDKSYIETVREFFMIGAMAKAETDKYMFGYTRLQDPSTYYHLTLHRDAKAWGKFNENNYLTDPSANLSIAKSIASSTEKLVVKGVNETMRYYANQIATYHGVAEALDVFDRATQTKVDGKTMKSIADERSGGMFTEYVEKWKKDIQGLREVSPLTRIVERLRGGWVKFQLGANIKVIASQFSSAPMALTHVSLRGMTYALAQTPKSFMPKLRREMKKYSLQAELRYADKGGNFNIGLLENAALEGMKRVSEGIIGLVEFGDESATAIMWNGVKFDIAKKYGVKVGELTEAQLTEAGKLLDEVILKDLPSYAMSTRSAFQRSTNPLAKGLVVQFVSDAIKQYSRLTEAFGEYRAITFELKAAKEELKKADASLRPEIEKRIKELEAERKRSRAQFGRTGGAVLTSMTMYALIATAMQYLLGKVDDDDEETFVQKLAGQFGSTVLSLIPIAGNLINSWIDGYDADFWAISMVNGIFDSMDSMTQMIEKGDASDMPKVFRNFLYNFGQIFGVPFRNMNTFVEAVLDKVDFFAGTGARFNYQGFFGKDNATRAALQKALDNDDNGLAEAVMNKLFFDAGLQPASATMQRLYKLVDKGFDVLPRAVGDNIAIDGTTYELTKAQRTRFKRVYSQADETVNKLLNSVNFTDRSDEVQAKAIRFIYDYYYDEARYDFIGTDGDSKKAVFGQVIDVETLAKVYAVASSIDADTDRKGNTINGTKKRKIMNYLQSLRMSAAEKYLLLAFLGYTASGGETQIRGYLRKFSLSAAETEIILSYCGYAA